jgi:glycosyltransferase involved in cell wall biosynthesis
MNILMMTNTYKPHVGGVARSVAAFTIQLRRLGHRVIVVCPEYEEGADDDKDTIRIPAIQHFNGSDFSAVLPIPGFLEKHLKDFEPDIVHSHHPFLVGSTAVRAATKHKAPLVYTQHTMFEQYTHYVPLDLPKMKQFVISLCTGYANLAEQVIAPSESIARILRERGVRKPIATIPTGVFIDEFEHGDGQAVRACENIPAEAFVVGHIGRLAPEKNLEFLSQAVAQFLEDERQAHFLVVGYGPSEKRMKNFFAKRRLQHRVHFLGKRRGQSLVDAYHASDVFAFSSKSETQGLVLIEAMAAGVPAVALGASGVRDVLEDGKNGYMLPEEEVDSFVEALKKMCRLGQEEKRNFVVKAKRTAESLSMHNCASKIVRIYRRLVKDFADDVVDRDESVWQSSIDQIKAEWEILSNLTSAVGDALQDRLSPPKAGHENL